MIVFDLKCTAGHVFEAWFGSSADYATQRERGLVACPICGDDAVEKAVMAPNLAAKANTARTPTTGSNAGLTAVKAAMKALAEAQAQVLSKSTWVGRDFADQARAMHLGEREHAAIHGQATRDEAKALADDGVPVAALPLPVVPPERSN